MEVTCSQLYYTLRLWYALAYGILLVAYGLAWAWPSARRGAVSTGQWAVATGQAILCLLRVAACLHAPCPKRCPPREPSQRSVWDLALPSSGVQWFLAVATVALAAAALAVGLQTRHLPVGLLLHSFVVAVVLEMGMWGVWCVSHSFCSRFCAVAR